MHGDTLSVAVEILAKVVRHIRKERGYVSSYTRPKRVIRALRAIGARRWVWRADADGRYLTHDNIVPRAYRNRAADWYTARELVAA